MFHSDDGTVVHNPRVRSKTDLDRLPRPARELVDPRRYGFLFGAQISARTAGVLSSRGCVFNCTFCIRSPYPPYRDRSAEDVLDEMAQLRREGYDTIIMADEYFLTNRPRVTRMMELLEEHQLGMRIIFQTRVNSVDDEIARKLKAGGTFAILFGIESGSADVLKFYNKGATVERARKAIEAAHRAGIFTYGGFIIGAPVETERHLQENIGFVTSVPLDFVSFHQLVYMYGTPLWQDAHGQGSIASSEYWVDADERFGGPSRAEITRWRTRAFRAFYMRPRYFAHLLLKCIRVRSTFPLAIAWSFLRQSLKDASRIAWVHQS
jgi:radical SAM superfamily enzyme YgiQ (UPF0313 family)